ncbi:hypothetical protein AWC00_24595 [Mycobacterium conspicuum]|nr:hypothetical protein AWC00_24595 [Mycobacterium conspicuum]
MSVRVASSQRRSCVGVVNGPSAVGDLEQASNHQGSAQQLAKLANPPSQSGLSRAHQGDITGGIAFQKQSSPASRGTRDWCDSRLP